MVHDEDIGVFFISPCPAKVSYVKNPIGVQKSAVDKVLSISDIYFKLISIMSKIKNPWPLSSTGLIGIVENVIQIVEMIELTEKCRCWKRDFPTVFLNGFQRIIGRLFSTAKENVRNLGFGAGMGLPNMKKYTDKMDIESELGKGTKVTTVRTTWGLIRPVRRTACSLTKASTSLIISAP